jgi:hypothetical protein
VNVMSLTSMRGPEGGNLSVQDIRYAALCKELLPFCREDCHLHSGLSGINGKEGNAAQEAIFRARRIFRKDATGASAADGRCAERNPQFHDARGRYDCLRKV